MEGYYEWRNVVVRMDKSELEQRLNIVEEIYSLYQIPERLQNDRYIFLARARDRENFERNYLIELLYENKVWTVFWIQGGQGVK